MDNVFFFCFSALDKIIVQGYKALQLEYFFTAGPDEVKAWTIQVRNVKNILPLCSTIVMGEGVVEAASMLNYPCCLKIVSGICITKWFALVVGELSWIMQETGVIFLVDGIRALGVLLKKNLYAHFFGS